MRYRALRCLSAMFDALPRFALLERKPPPDFPAAVFLRLASSQAVHFTHCGAPSSRP
jgi:hypothetical protein